MTKTGIAGVLLGLALWVAPAQAQTMDQAIYTFLLLDRVEMLPGIDSAPLEYDAKAWIGNDYNRLWLKAEGTHATGGEAAGVGGVEAQALFSRLIAPFWEIQGGVRYDGFYGTGSGDGRAFLAVGLEGLAPYWFEVEPFLFVSQDGDVSARLEASYELLFTQRLVLQPDLEVNVAFQDVPEYGVGSGFNDLELGLRLRYEVRREVAPYVGFTWHRRLGQTADLARALGEETGESALLAGIRLWR